MKNLSVPYKQTVIILNDRWCESLTIYRGKTAKRVWLWPWVWTPALKRTNPLCSRQITDICLALMEHLLHSQLRDKTSDVRRLTCPWNETALVRCTPTTSETSTLSFSLQTDFWVLLPKQYPRHKPLLDNRLYAQLLLSVSFYSPKTPGIYITFTSSHLLDDLTRNYAQVRLSTQYAVWSTHR